MSLTSTLRDKVLKDFPLAVRGNVELLLVIREEREDGALVLTTVHMDEADAGVRSSRLNMIEDAFIAESHKDSFELYNDQNISRVVILPGDLPEEEFPAL